jgi:Uma2 family endonuclease
MVAVRQEMTKEEFAEIDVPGRYDLVDGELWSLSPTQIPHGQYAADLTIELGIYLRSSGSGRLYSGEMGYELDETGRTILCPDVSFVQSNRLPPKGSKGFFRGVPDLAVEIVSESERPRQVQTKVARYLDAGARLVWCVYPDQQQVVVYSDEEPPQILGVDDQLDGRDVLPGFSLPLSELFA